MFIILSLFMLLAQILAVKLTMSLVKLLVNMLANPSNHEFPTKAAGGNGLRRGGATGGGHLLARLDPI